MKNFDLYVGLKRRRTELSDSISTAEKEISRLEIEKAEAERELLRAEALGDRGVDSLQKRVKTNEDAILANRTAVEKAKKAIATVQEEKVRVRPAALEETRTEYRGRYKKALQNLLAKLEAAGEAEIEAQAIKAEAVRLAAQIDVDELGCGLPIIDHVVLDRDGGGGNVIKRFVSDCRAQGMPLDD